MISRRPLLLLTAAGATAACSSPNPLLYVIDPLPGPTHTGAARRIVVRQVALPRYLERPQIVRSIDEYRVTLLGDDWWGEPLDAMITRVLVEELAQRLPGSAVYTDSGAISATPDVAIEINIQRMDVDRQGVVRLLAQIATDARKINTRSINVGKTPAGPSTAALVAAISKAVAAMADQAAEMLVAR